MLRLSVLLSLISLLAGSTTAFAPRVASTHRIAHTQLFFGIPSWMDPNSSSKKSSDDETSKEDKDTKKIGLSGIFQLITAGAGAPFLGDFEGVDKETGKFMFSLEANNLVRP
jgi:hypothetical protein